MIWKLLRKNINAWQLAAYALSSLIGLAILLVAIQFYRDASSAISPSGDGIGLISSRNIVISKPVSLSSTITGDAPSFSEEEIAEIAAQPWASGVARFQAADFRVHAGVDFGNRAMTTALFLESIPDSLLDINQHLWNFDPAHPTIPIVISKDYLALYNFGFASSGNMPMLSEDILSSVPLQITLSGNGQTSTLPGRIVGYSSWLNTIAVPQAFMDWAHNQFGAPTLADPSRLVITVSDPADPAIDSFLADHDFELAGPQNDLGRATYFLKLLTSVVIAVGAVITVLALGILMLSLFLLIQKNRRTIRGLILLGYSHSQIAGCYIRLVAIINACIIALAACSLACIAPFWQKSLDAISLAHAPMLPTILIGLAIMGAITIINIAVIRRLVRSN